MIDLVLIATTMGEGRSWLAAQPAPPAKVVIVTRRSPYAAHGQTAAAVLITPAAQQLPTDVRTRLVAGAMPCVATVATCRCGNRGCSYRHRRGVSTAQN